jgi:hypothetical protein
MVRGRCGHRGYPKSLFTFSAIPGAVGVKPYIPGSCSASRERSEIRKEISGLALGLSVAV